MVFPCTLWIAARPKHTSGFDANSSTNRKNRVKLRNQRVRAVFLQISGTTVKTAKKRECYEYLRFSRDFRAGLSRWASGPVAHIFFIIRALHWRKCWQILIGPCFLLSFLLHAYRWPQWENVLSPLRCFKIFAPILFFRKETSQPCCLKLLQNILQTEKHS